MVKKIPEGWKLIIRSDDFAFFRKNNKFVGYKKDRLGLGYVVLMADLSGLPRTMSGKMERADTKEEALKIVERFMRENKLKEVI